MNSTTVYTRSTRVDSRLLAARGGEVATVTREGDEPATINRSSIVIRHDFAVVAIGLPVSISTDV